MAQRSSPERSPRGGTSVDVTGRGRNVAEVVPGVIAFLATVAEFFLLIPFLVFAWDTGAVASDGQWWRWSLSLTLVALAWHFFALIRVSGRGREWLPALVPGALAALVGVALTGLFALVPGVVLCLGTTLLAGAVTKRS